MTSAAEILLKTAITDGERMAVSDKDRRITYNELLFSAYELSQAIRRQISGKNNPIMMLSSRKVESVIGIWAIILSGNFYVAVDCKAQNARLVQITDIVKPKIILETDPGKCDGICNDVPRLQVEQTGNVFSYEAISEDICRLHMIETDPIYMVFTSGSTGKPKAVIKKP